MRIEDALNWLNVFFAQFGYWAIFLGSLIEITPLGWAVPGGGILLVAGYLAKTTESVALVPVMASGVLGAWLAFSLAYFVGKQTGTWLIIKLRQEQNAKLAKSMLANHGGMILTTSMLANLTRFWISYVAGVDRYSFSKFSFYALISSLGWVSMMVMAGYFAGFEEQNLKKVLNNLGIFAWILVIAAIVVIVKYIKVERKAFVESELREEPKG